MALVKGTGLVAGATSYVDFADYVNELDDLGVDGVALSTLVPADVEPLLIQASRYLDRLCWHGFPISRDDRLSALALPLQCWQVAAGSPYYPAGYYLNDDLPNPEDMPPEVLAACCYIADDMRVLGGPQQPTDPNAVKKREDVKGDYEVEFATESGQQVRQQRRAHS